MSSGVLLASAVAVGLGVLLLRGRDASVRLPATGSPGRTDSIEAALAAGRKIDAIQLYRERDGVSLREAKDAVERLQRRG